VLLEANWKKRVSRNNLRLGMNEEREGECSKWLMGKDWELKATFVRGTCRLAAFVMLSYNEELWVPIDKQLTARNISEIVRVSKKLDMRLLRARILLRSYHGLSRNEVRLIKWRPYIAWCYLPHVRTAVDIKDRQKNDCRYRVHSLEIWKYD